MLLLQPGDTIIVCDFVSIAIPVQIYMSFVWLSKKTRPLFEIVKEDFVIILPFLSIIFGLTAPWNAISHPHVDQKNFFSSYRNKHTQRID